MHKIHKYRCFDTSPSIICDHSVAFYFKLLRTLTLFPNHFQILHFGFLLFVAFLTSFSSAFNRGSLSFSAKLINIYIVFQLIVYYKSLSYEIIVKLVETIQTAKKVVKKTESFCWVTWVVSSRLRREFSKNSARV